MTRRRHARACCWALGLALAWPSAHALAQDEIARGAVIKIERQEIYVALGSKQGVSDGAPLRLKRPLQLRHPVTRAMVNDWLPIGSATVTQAGATMSRAIVGELVGALRPGDIAEVLVQRPEDPEPVVPTSPTPTTPTTPTPSAPTPSTPAPTQPAADPATLEVLQVFAAQIGQPLDARIAGWEQFLSTHGGSPYAPALRQELDTLRRLRAELTAETTEPSAERIASVRHNARTRTPAGAALQLVFVLDQPERVASAFLHYRARGARTFHSVLLVREHERTLRGQIPGDLVAPPGLDYFVEVSAPSGRAGLALGSPAQPVQVEVPSPPLTDRFGADPGRSSAQLTAEYLDFSTFDHRAGDHTDRLFSATIDFTYRLRGVLESLGVGYGVLSGRGGFADEVWTQDSPVPRAGFRYGHAELAVGTSEAGPQLGLALRLLAGVGRDGFGMGAEVRARIGPRDGTNLQLVGRTIEELGFLSDVRFGVVLPRRLHLGLSVGATDLPAKGDIAVKLGTELVWSGVANLSLILRASWQGRDIDHGGLGGGGGLGVSW